MNGNPEYVQCPDLLALVIAKPFIQRSMYHLINPEGLPGGVPTPMGTNIERGGDNDRARTGR
jgi:hypothetical protein